MAVDIVLPQIGESMTEATIGRWLKRVGDRIERYEALVEVETDKVSTEVTSITSGVLLEIAAPEGATVPVGTLLARIGEPGEVAVSSTPEADVGATATTVTTDASESARPRRANGPPITPVVARLAAEYGIDLSQIRGTGAGGRVSKKDVLRYIEERQKAAAAPPPAPVAPPPPLSTPVAPPPPPPTLAAPPTPGYQPDYSLLAPMPVVENFTVSAQTTVVVSGVRSDDHGNDPGTASLLNTDNLDQWGHIEQPGDRDLFRITVAQDMTIVVRVTDLAAGMQPRLRLLAGDGTTPVPALSLAKNYPALVYTARAGSVIYAEVSHVDPAASGGVYRISAGSAIASDGLNQVYIPLVKR